MLLIIALDANLSSEVRQGRDAMVSASRAGRPAAAAVAMTTAQRLRSLG